MKVSLPIETMSTLEKIEAMEVLWDDLCRRGEHIPSPEWHASVLRERDMMVKEGKEGPLEWSEAKKKIRNTVE